MIFIHIGAGAGDKDPKFNFRDGFTEYVKKYPITKKEREIYLVEANPKNIKKLRKCWVGFKNVYIFNNAIVSNKIKKKKLKLFYALDDGPHYQMLSSNKNFVQTNFPSSSIKTILVKTIRINDFMMKYFKNKTIHSFSIDIEGDDFEIINNLDLKKFYIKNISFEYLHLSKIQKKKIIKKLIFNGYSYNGFGVDHNNIDWLFTKKKSLWNNLMSKILPYVHRIYYKRINRLIFKL